MWIGAVQENPIGRANQEAAHLKQTVQHVKAHVRINLMLGTC
jgi:hypothetical protein